jgi:hypothetical protein
MESFPPFTYLITLQCILIGSSSLNEIIIGSYCKKSDAIIFYRFEIDIFFTAIKIIFLIFCHDILAMILFRILTKSKEVHVLICFSYRTKTVHFS